MYVGIASTGGSISKMCFEAASSTPGSLWSILSSMGVSAKVQTNDSILQTKVQAEFGLQKLSGVACATETSTCMTGAQITSNLPSGSNVVQLDGGALNLKDPIFEASYVKVSINFTYTLTGNISVSTTCADEVCGTFEEYLGATSIKVTGTSASDGYSFTAPLGTVALSSDFILKNAVFKFSPGASKEMGIVGEMNVAADDVLKMTTEITTLEGSEVKLNGNMVGIWFSGE